MEFLNAGFSSCLKLDVSFLIIVVIFQIPPNRHPIPTFPFFVTILFLSFGQQNLLSMLVSIYVEDMFLLGFRIRFHYGHPDVFDRIFHITRGGISKGSRGINLSEDIFAGNDLKPPTFN